MDQLLLITVTLLAPYAIFYFMTRMNLEGLSYIMLYIFSLALITTADPALGLFSLLHVTLIVIIDFASLK